MKDDQRTAQITREHGMPQSSLHPLLECTVSVYRSAKILDFCLLVRKNVLLLPGRMHARDISYGP